MTDAGVTDAGVKDGAAAADAVVADDDVPEGLRAEFFEAVRGIIAASGISGGGSAIGGPAIGGDVRPEDEPVRFVAMRGSRHPDAELNAAERGQAGRPVRMEAAFMGLTGPMGVMPDHYTELVVARDRARDEALGVFLDLFNHRALSLFYRAWAKYRLPVGFAETRGSLADPVSAALAALAGQSGVAGGAAGEGRGDPRVLGAAALLARRVRSPDALRRALSSLFGLPVEVIELRPRRIRIRPDDRTRLARGGGYAGLARDAVLGASAIDVAGRFRVRIGPIDGTRFDAFFDRAGYRDRLVAMVRQVAGPTADFDMQLVLRRQAVPRTRIGGGAGAAGSRLGENSWLLHGPAERDREDAVLPGRATAAR